MEKILGKKGTELAIVLSTSDYLQRTNKVFFSNEEDTIQIGSLFFQQGSEVIPHIHKPKESASAPMEVLIVLGGTPVAAIYDEDRSPVATVTLKLGDILVQKCGGHGFHFAHDSVVLEIKRGPYHGKDSDKEEI